MEEEKVVEKEELKDENDEASKIVHIPLYKAPRKPNRPSAGFYAAQRGIPKPQLDRIEVFLQAHGSSSNGFDLKRANEFREFFRGPRLDESKLDDYLKRQQQQQETASASSTSAQLLTYDKFIDMFKNVFNLNEEEEPEKSSTS